MGIVKQADCVIFAAGERVAPEIVRTYLQPNTYIITADAGYAACVACGLSPDLAVGDFDSQDVPSEKVQTIRLNPVKDDTDTAVALQEAVQRGFRQIVLFGATGGRLDHTYANLDLCAYAAEKGVDLLIADNHHRIFALQNASALIEGDAKKYVSVFAVGGPCTLSLKGFYYPLEDYTFAPFCGLGVSNETAAPTAEISVREGVALVFVTDKDF